MGLRIHGGASRSYPRKSLRLIARDDYGTPYFDFPFFGDDGPERHHRLILRNSGNDHGATLMADAYLQGLMGPLTIDTQAYTPTVLFINGEYWGIYGLRERYDEYYLAEVHGADVEAAALLDLSAMAISAGDPSELRAYTAVLNRIAEAGPPTPQLVEEVRRAFDLENFFDYVIAQVFAGNFDWPGGNTRLWRQAGGDPDDPAPLDGRWRWLLFDLDLFGSGGHRYDPAYDPLSQHLAPSDDPGHRGGVPLLFNWLMDDQELRNTFLNRFAEHLNTTFHPERTLPLLEAAEERLAPEIPSHVHRWQAPPSVDAWRGLVDRLRSFVERRPDEQRQHLVERFGLAGTTEVSVDINVASGAVRVGGIVIDDDTPGIIDGTWHGTYFEGVPLEVEAVPAPGWRFARWDGAPADTAHQAHLILSPREDLQLRPIFVRD